MIAEIVFNIITRINKKAFDLSVWTYGGPFWSKLNKIFSLLIDLFVLAVYFILLYMYIVTFCRAFFSLPSMNFWHILQIVFFTMYGLFLAPFLNNFFPTVWISFGYPPRIIFGYCQLNFWFRDALRDLDLYVYKCAHRIEFFPSLWKHGGICANSNCTNSSKCNSRNRPNSTNSPHKWAILLQC